MIIDKVLHHLGKNVKTKIVIRNMLAAFVLKGLGLLISLFTMPAYIQFFSEQKVLGVWFTVLSILTWILSFDFGIGNGLRNRLAASLAVEDYKEAREYISSTYIMMGSVVVVFLVTGYLLIQHISWNGMFNVSASVVSTSVMQETVRNVFIAIIFQFFFRIISSVVYAMQYSALNGFVSLLTSILQLILVLVLPSFSAEQNLRMLSFTYILSSNIPLILLTVWIFLKPLKGCAPRIRQFRVERAKSVFSLSSIFFICQILYMVIANTNEFFIAQYTDPSYVVEYQIYYRLFSLGSMVITLTLTPVWSAVSRAIAENDYFWIKKLYRKLKYLALVGVGLEFLLILVLQPIMDFWLGDNSVDVNYFYAVVFALFGSSMLYQSTLSTFVCGMGRMKLQAIAYAIGVILKFAIIHFGISLTDSWIIVILSNVLILIPYCVIQEIDLTRFLNKQLKVNYRYQL